MHRLNSGPERLSLAERFIALFPVPYLASCLLMVVILGPVLSILVEYSLTRDISKAVPSHLQPTPFQLLLNSATIIWIVSLFYLPRYMRRKVLEAEHSLSRVLPNGDEDFHRLFAETSALKPQLAIWTLLVLLDMPVILQPPLFDLNYVLQSQNVAVALVASVIPGFIFSIGASSAIWVYVGSLIGIRRMGTVSMKLPAYYVDPMLGLGPVGSLSLSLAAAYFGLLGLLLIVTSGWILVSPPFLGLELSLLILGLVMFFHPMRRLHARMLQQKQAEREKLREKLAQRLQNPLGLNSTNDVNQILMLDLMKREVSSIATWPFDTQVLGKLFAIVLSVIAIILSRIIAIILHI